MQVSRYKNPKTGRIHELHSTTSQGHAELLARRIKACGGQTEEDSFLKSLVSENSEAETNEFLRAVLEGEGHGVAPAKI